MKRRNNAALAVLCFIYLLCGACVSADSKPLPSAPEVLSFAECMTVPGHKMLKTFPAQCIAPDGKVFVDPAGSKPIRRVCKDNCGNGDCEEMVCMAAGCPCPESKASCPADCKN